MSAPGYMPFYVADYLADTTHLTRGEHGAYLLLLMAMWRAGGRLPSEDARLAKIALCSPAEWSEIRPTIIVFFKRRGGHLMHKRLAEEMAKYANRIVRAKRGGKASAAKRSNENNENLRSQVQPKSNQSESESERRGEEPPLTPPLELVGGTDLILRGEDPFERWWKTYPRKVGKPKSEPAYRRALSRIRGCDPAAKILSATEAMLPYWRWQIANGEERFIPHPSTWLNRDGWNDDLKHPPPVEPKRWNPMMQAIGDLSVQ